MSRCTSTIVAAGRTSRKNSPWARPASSQREMSVTYMRVRTTSASEAPEASAEVKQFVSWGAGPRASQYLVLGAKARAAMDGRPIPDLDDVNSVAVPVLRHRLVVNFRAEAEGVTPERLIRTGNGKR